VTYFQSATSRFRAAQPEVNAAKRIIERSADRHRLWPRNLIANAGYESAEMLAWLAHEV
jgi:hypothetical protein